MSNENAPYALVALSATEAAGVASWTATGTRDNEKVKVEFEGNCPFCGHPARVDQWIRKEVLVGTLAAPTTVPVPPPQEWTAEQITRKFECDHQNHSGRPDGVTAGCGRVWNVQFRWWEKEGKAGAFVISAGSRPTDAEIGFDERWSELKSKELASLRGQAEAWGKVMAGLAGLVGAAEIIKGRELVKGVCTDNCLWGLDWQEAIGWALLVTIGAAASAAIFAGVAAHGLPKRISLESTQAYGGETAALDRQLSKLSANVPVWLTLALVATITAVVAAAFVGYGIWFQLADKGAGTTKMCVRAEGGAVIEVADLPTFSSGEASLVSCPEDS